jgi:hypothetical protein
MSTSELSHRPGSLRAGLDGPPSPPSTIHPRTIRPRRSRTLLDWIRNMGSGIVSDIRSRAPYYLSDWLDAWNYRVVPATALIFFSKWVAKEWSRSATYRTQCIARHCILLGSNRDHQSIRCLRGSHFFLHGSVYIFLLRGPASHNRGGDWQVLLGQTLHNEPDRI